MDVVLKEQHKGFLWWWNRSVSWLCAWIHEPAHVIKVHRTVHTHNHHPHTYMYTGQFIYTHACTHMLKYNYTEEIRIRTVDHIVNIYDTIVFQDVTYHRGKLSKEYRGSVCNISFNCMWICSYLKEIKFLKR